MVTITMILGAIGTFFSGGIAVAILSRFKMSKKEESEYILMLVKQLQENVNSNNEEIKKLKVEVDNWRDKYYTELEEKNKLSNELRTLRLELKKFNQQHTT